MCVVVIVVIISIVNNIMMFSFVLSIAFVIFIFMYYSIIKHELYYQCYSLRQPAWARRRSAGGARGAASGGNIYIYIYIYIIHTLHT